MSPLVDRAVDGTLSADITLGHKFSMNRLDLTMRPARTARDPCKWSRDEQAELEAGERASTQVKRFSL